MKTTVPIVFISDDNYTLGTSVAIESIIRNKKEDSIYKIYILGIDMSDQNKCILEGQSRNNTQIRVIAQDNKYNNMVIDHPYITSAMFYKFDIANLFSQYDKLIYLDGDIVVNSDLTEFFNIDLENNYAGVVKDLISFYEKKQQYELKTQSIFASGGMLLNVKKIREDNLYEKFISTLTTNSLAKYDQEVFNIVFDKKVKFLSFKYNFINIYYLIDDLNDYREKSGCSVSADLEEELIDYQNSLKNPLIIHYAGDKPWNLKKGPMFNIWKKYFKKSPYKNTKLKYQKNKKLFEFNIEPNSFVIRLFGIKFSTKLTQFIL